MPNQFIPDAGPTELSSLCFGVAEHAPLPMATVDGAANVVRYANPAFCAMLKVTEADVLSKPLAGLLPQRDKCLGTVERVLRTKVAESHTEVDDEDGASSPLFWSYTVWPVASRAHEALVGVMIQVSETAQVHQQTVAMNQALLLGAVRQHELAEAAHNLSVELRAEILERELAEAGYRASEERYRTLFDLGPVGVYSCDADGAIDKFNRRAVELWGREPDSGQKLERFCGPSRLFKTDGTSLPYDACPMACVLRGESPSVQDMEVLMERPDGTRLSVVLNVRALRNDAGELTGAINCFYDITERRLLEDALAARAAALARADRSKDEFLAMLAHELRGPLAPLRNATQILKVAGVGTREHTQAEGVVVRQIENMTRMIDDLLDVSRITEGKIELRKRAVTLASVLEAVVDGVRPAIQARGQELATQLPVETIFLDADSTRLEQIFSNLLTNASKYNHDGGHISIRAEQVVNPETNAHEVVVRVTDDGIGIGDDLLPRVFDLFVQAAPAAEQSQGGLGIGLTLVKRLVKMHGGRVEAHSAGLGCGSEFVVRLPILVAQHAEVPVSAVPAGRLSRRILIVDDHQDSALSMATLQRIKGHETRTAFNGKDAIAIAEEFRPEVVLLDIGLPGMDGYKVVRHMRGMPALADTFFVGLSGYGNKADYDRALAAGFHEYMVKPADSDLLSEWIAKRNQAPT